MDSSRKLSVGLVNERERERERKREMGSGIVADTKA